MILVCKLRNTEHRLSKEAASLLSFDNKNVCDDLMDPLHLRVIRLLRSEAYRPYFVPQLEKRVFVFYQDLVVNARRLQQDELTVFKLRVGLR